MIRGKSPGEVISESQLVALDRAIEEHGAPWPDSPEGTGHYVDGEHSEWPWRFDGHALVFHGQYVALWRSTGVDGDPLGGFWTLRRSPMFPGHGDSRVHETFSRLFDEYHDR